jgi:hypothetical protein
LEVGRSRTPSSSDTRANAVGKKLLLPRASWVFGTNDQGRKYFAKHGEIIDTILYAK